MCAAQSTITVPTKMGTVRISAMSGKIRLDAGSLVEQCGTEFLDRLIEQAIDSLAIESVAVERTSGTATIEYDARRWGIAQALQEIALMLEGQRSRQNGESEVRLNLQSIPGTVTRVDRVRSESSLGTAARGSTGRRSWLTRWLPTRAGTRVKPSQRTAAIMQGVIIHFAPAASELDWPMDVVGPQLRVVSPDDETALARIDQPLGWRRAANLAAASGCFLLSIVGFITPGIPTIPFVLGTSYFLAHSIPALNVRLRESRIFGPMVRDWEDEGGMRQSTKVRTLVVMAALLGTTVLISGGSIPVLMMSSAMGGIDLLVVLAIPTIAGDAAESQPPRLALESSLS